MRFSIVCDLDGVVYRGRVPIPGSADAIRRAVDSGFNLVFATNNSSRTRTQVADKIRDVVGVDVAESAVVTSADAAVLALPTSAERCHVIGGPGLRDAVTGSGRTIVDNGADAVIVGIDPEFEYGMLANAANEIRLGALFVATNLDATFPTENGLAPGAGAIVAAVAAASGVTPVNAGKPEALMRSLIRQQGVESAWVIGDRIETDIRMATNEDDWHSILVMTGVTQHDEVVSEADFVVADLESAIDLVLAHQDRQ